MKKILILVSKKVNKHNVLAEYIEKQGNCAIDLKCYEDVEITIKDRNVKILIDGVNIASYGLVYFRTIKARNEFLAGAIAVYLEVNKIPYIDKGIIYSQRRDKLTSSVKMALAGLPVIDTYYCDYSKIAENIDKIKTFCKFPVVVKDLHEHYLHGIYLLKSEPDFKKIEKAFKDKKHKRILFQSFVDIEKEYRILMLGGKIKSANLRIERDLTKLKVGYKDESEVEKYVSAKSLDKRIKNISRKAVKVFDYQICGVDICVEKGTGNYYILEANRSPGFNYDDKISSEIIEVSKYLIKKIH